MTGSYVNELLVVLFWNKKKFIQSIRSFVPVLYWIRTILGMYRVESENITFWQNEAWLPKQCDARHNICFPFSSNMCVRVEITFRSILFAFHARYVRKK